MFVALIIFSDLKAEYNKDNGQWIVFRESSC